MSKTGRQMENKKERKQDRYREKYRGTKDRERLRDTLFPEIDVRKESWQGRRGSFCSPGHKFY